MSLNCEKSNLPEHRKMLIKLQTHADINGRFLRKMISVIRITDQ